MSIFVTLTTLGTNIKRTLADGTNAREWLPPVPRASGETTARVPYSTAQPPTFQLASPSRHPCRQVVSPDPSSRRAEARPRQVAASCPRHPRRNKMTHHRPRPDSAQEIDSGQLRRNPRASTKLLFLFLFSRILSINGSWACCRVATCGGTVGGGGWN